VRIDGRHAQSGEAGELRHRRFLRHGGLERAAAEAEAQELGDARTALRDQVGAGDPAVDDAVLDVLGDVRGSYQENLDRRVAARKRERALSRLLRAEARVVEQGDRRLPETPLRRDGDLQAVGESGILRSSAVR
jgi:hypothetical protein